MGRAITLLKENIAHRESVLAALEPGTDAIINFAAESHVDRSILSADDFLRTNVMGTQVLLDGGARAWRRSFSTDLTDEVMGSLPDDSDSYFNEESAFAPNSRMRLQKPLLNILCGLLAIPLDWTP